MVKNKADDLKTAVDPPDLMENEVKLRYEITDLEEANFDLKEMLIPFLQQKLKMVRLPFETPKVKYNGIDYERKEKREEVQTEQYHKMRHEKFKIEIPKKLEDDKEKKGEWYLRPEYFYSRHIHVLLKRVGEYYRKHGCALLEVQAPINICGDTHGQFGDLIRIFNSCGFPSKNRYLFLGDYVDRGRHSVDVILFLFCLKLTFPRKVHLLRGNHELKAINKAYGFLIELKQRFRNINQTEVENLHLHFNEVFSWMPLAGCVSKRILCMHGGISPHLNSLDDIRKIPLPLETAKTNPLACDLLWADPDATVHQFEPNRVRAISHIFGKEQVDEMCKKLDIDLIIRAHQVVEYGYAFFAERRLVTVFSASRYQEDLANCAGVVNVNKNLELSFTQLKPEDFEFQNRKFDMKEQLTAPEPSAK